MLAEDCLLNSLKVRKEEVERSLNLWAQLVVNKARARLSDNN